MILILFVLVLQFHNFLISSVCVKMQNQFNDVNCKIISVLNAKCKSKILVTPILVIVGYITKMGVARIYNFFKLCEHLCFSNISPSVFTNLKFMFYK